MFAILLGGTVALASLYLYAATAQSIIGYVGSDGVSFSIGDGRIDYGYDWGWIRQKMFPGGGAPPLGWSRRPLYLRVRSPAPVSVPILPFTVWGLAVVACGLRGSRAALTPAQEYGWIQVCTILILAPLVFLSGVASPERSALPRCLPILCGLVVLVPSLRALRWLRRGAIAAAALAAAAALLEFAVDARALLASYLPVPLQRAYFVCASGYWCACLMALVGLLIWLDRRAARCADCDCEWCGRLLAPHDSCPPRCPDCGSPWRWQAERGVCRRTAIMCAALIATVSVTWATGADWTITIPAIDGVQRISAARGALMYSVRESCCGGRVMFVPMWVSLPLCASFMLLAMSRFRRVKAPETGACRVCGYNLYANVSGICPECGTPVPPSSAARRARSD